MLQGRNGVKYALNSTAQIRNSTLQVLLPLLWCLGSDVKTPAEGNVAKSGRKLPTKSKTNSTRVTRVSKIRVLENMVREFRQRAWNNGQIFSPVHYL